MTLSKTLTGAPPPPHWTTRVATNPGDDDSWRGYWRSGPTRPWQLLAYGASRQETSERLIKRVLALRYDGEIIVLPADQRPHD